MSTHAHPLTGNRALIDVYRMDKNPEARHRATPEVWLPRDMYKALDEIDIALAAPATPTGEPKP